MRVRPLSFIVPITLRPGEGATTVKRCPGDFRITSFRQVVPDAKLTGVFTSTGDGFLFVFLDIQDTRKTGEPRQAVFLMHGETTGDT